MLLLMLLCGSTSCWPGLQDVLAELGLVLTSHEVITLVRSSASAHGGPGKQVAASTADILAMLQCQKQPAMDQPQQYY